MGAACCGEAKVAQSPSEKADVYARQAQDEAAKQKQRADEEAQRQKQRAEEEAQKLKQQAEREAQQKKQRAEEEQRLKQQAEQEAQRQKQVPQAGANSLLVASGVASIGAICSKFTTFQDVTQLFRLAGLATVSLIFGVDYTTSNKTQGKKTFNNKSLHALEASTPNPYQQVISTMGNLLEPFDKDHVISAFGFGDAETKGTSVFPLTGSGEYHSVQELLDAYTAKTPEVKLMGPTNFAPLIKKSVEIVKQTKEYHILVIIADGQVNNEKENIDAIVAASEYPLSIIMVGVGDGPWDGMTKFDNSIPTRQFDNFQFVDFHASSAQSTFHEISFAINALMEIPDQYKRILELNLLAKL